MITDAIVMELTLPQRRCARLATSRPFKTRSLPGSDLLCSNCTADQGLCFRYTDNTIPLYLNPKFQASSLFL